jgi:valine dehydrogenase (NAD+)
MPASPCALGGALDNELAEALRARIVCGSAENQMASVSAGQALHDRGVLYTPDRIVNAGGLIQAVGKMSGYSYERAKDKTCKIFDATRAVLALAQEQVVPPAEAAETFAAERLAAAPHGRFWLPQRSRPARTARPRPNRPPHRPATVA